LSFGFSVGIIVLSGFVSPTDSQIVSAIWLVTDYVIRRIFRF